MKAPRLPHELALRRDVIDRHHHTPGIGVNDNADCYDCVERAWRRRDMVSGSPAAVTALSSLIYRTPLREDVAARVVRLR